MISFFLVVMRCPCKTLRFLQHDFRTRYPDETSCFLGPLGDLRMRFHAFLAFMRFLDEITSFLAVDGGEMNVEGCGRLSVQVGWFVGGC